MEDALNEKHFLWGLLLAWIPWVPTMIGVGYMFIGINNSKATGLAAVAGGMAELLVWWGVAAMFVSQIAAIVWLFRSLLSCAILRSTIAVVSITASGMTLLLLCTFLFLAYRFMHSTPAR
jgi:hypothetical protein